MSNTKMDVVVRRDLNMVPGLLAAQVLHIGMEFIRQKMMIKEIHPETVRDISLTNKESEWIPTPYVSVLAVDTPEELAVIIKRAQEENLLVREWRDVIPSKVLDGQVIECLVGISIGPDESDTLRKVTGKLPLF
jgi:peptidyl-tRNA hydrolase